MRIPLLVIRSIAIIGLTLSLGSGLAAQRYSNVDFDTVQQRITDSTSAYYYPRLLRRYLAYDRRLTAADYRHLYYGYVFDEQYDPVDPGRLRQEQEMQALFKSGSYRKARTLARRLLHDDPLNTDYLFWVGRCSEQLRDTQEALRCRARWRSLITVICASGDGRSEASAYVVIRVPDEYQVLQALGLKHTAHILHGDRQRGLYTDLLALAPNRLGVDTLFFNTNWSYQHLSETIDTFSGNNQ